MTSKQAAAKQGEKEVDFGAVDASQEDDLDGAEFDLEDVKDVVYAILPRAIYPAEIDTVEFGQSSNDNPMWTLRIKITDGEFKGRTLFNHQVFTDAGMPRVKQFLQRVAPELLGQGAIKPSHIADEGLLEGKACRIRVGTQRYQGQKRNNIREILAPEAGDTFLS